MRRGSFLLLVLLSACGSSRGGPVKQPDGAYALACKSPLSDCLRHAERVCKDQGYWVSEARDVRELLGHEQGQSRVLIEKSDATIYCGTRAASGQIRLVRPEPEVPATAPTASTAPAEPAAPKPTCVPGASQACVGPAGCSGGQVCAVDGTHFESCDCGGAKSAGPESAPSH